MTRVALFESGAEDPVLITQFPTAPRAGDQLEFKHESRRQLRWVSSVILSAFEVLDAERGIFEQPIAKVFLLPPSTAELFQGALIPVCGVEADLPPVRPEER